MPIRTSEGLIPHSVIENDAPALIVLHAEDVTGCVIERCGHRIASEQPNTPVDALAELLHDAVQEELDVGRR
jgi:hypothetical protein